MSSYPKSKDGATTRSSRPRKRSFHGNQYSKNESSDKDEESVGAKKLSSATSDKNQRSALETKEARKTRKDELQAQNEIYEEEEGLQYGAGITG